MLYLVQVGVMMMIMSNAEHCVCCGQVIPEGSQYCIVCGYKLKQKPKIDLVNVVRCKDCKYAKLDIREKGTAVCRRVVLKNNQPFPFNWETTHTDFCSYGERKEK